MGRKRKAAFQGGVTAPPKLVCRDTPWRKPEVLAASALIVAQGGPDGQREAFFLSALDVDGWLPRKFQLGHIGARDDSSGSAKLSTCRH